MIKLLIGIGIGIWIGIEYADEVRNLIQMFLETIDDPQSIFS